LIEILEREEENANWKRVYRWFSRLTIWLIPLGFYSVYIAMVIEGGILAEDYEDGLSRSDES